MGAGGRRGLSTLEMVLCLPILLFVMALMINFGTVACWKVRGLSMARHAAWGSRWPRSGSSNPRPEYWPASASVGSGGAGDVPELDHPRVDQPVARGPLPYGTTVREELLDPTRGLRRGSAGITREFPMLARMGDYGLEARTHLLDNKWQYQRMGLSYRGGLIVLYDGQGNTLGVIPAIYGLEKAPAALVDAYVRAVLSIYYAPFRPQLAPLDRDDEFLHYTGSAPDFHPRLNRCDDPFDPACCSLDRDLARSRVESLIDRIDEPDIPGVPQEMTGDFIDLYESVIRRYEQLINSTPPPPPGQIAAMQAEIAQLESKITILEQFLATLQN